MQRLIFLFFDGLGLAPSDENNPLSFTPMPFIQSLLNRPLVSGADICNSDIVLKSLDATLQVPGIPQSATGQTALFTGINAARRLWGHLPAFPNETLIQVIKEHSILKRVTGLGKKATFANAYTSRYFADVARGKLVHSVTTHCVLAASLPLRSIDDLRAGKAVYWDITHQYLIQRGETAVGKVCAGTAGRNLAALASEFDLVLFESFLSDLIGHSGDPHLAGQCLTMYDDFIGAIVNNMDKDTTLILSSDHGNIEAINRKSHTCNPVPLLAVGKSAAHFATAGCITDIAPAIIDFFS